MDKVWLVFSGFFNDKLEGVYATKQLAEAKKREVINFGEDYVVSFPHDVEHS